MKSSPILHPTNEPLAMVRKWHLVVCEDNMCTALLLSYFEHWYNWKIQTNKYNKFHNDIAAQQDEHCRFSESVWLSKSLHKFRWYFLNTYSLKNVSNGLNFLAKKGFISIHSNPNHNVNHHKSFRFYPERCNEWLKNEYPQFQQENLIKKSRLALKLQHVPKCNSKPIKKSSAKYINSHKSLGIANKEDVLSAQCVCSLDHVKNSSGSGRAFGKKRESNNKNQVIKMEKAVDFDKKTYPSCN